MKSAHKHIKSDYFRQKQAMQQKPTKKRQSENSPRMSRQESDIERLLKQQCGELINQLLAVKMLN